MPDGGLVLVLVLATAAAAAAASLAAAFFLPGGVLVLASGVVGAETVVEGAASFLPGGGLVSASSAAAVRAIIRVTAAFCLRLVIWSAKAEGSLAENGAGMGSAILAGIAAPKLNGL